MGPEPWRFSQHTAIEETLELWGSALGGARDAYRGHAYRVLNQTRRILGRDDADDTLAVVCAFHDLGIWSDRTFDYLSPSSSRAAAYCLSRGPDLDVDLVVRVIEQHHALRRQRNPPSADIVEAMRRGDRVDLSRGWFREGLSASFVKELTVQWPYAGFHGVMLRTAFAWAIRHPWRPLPMLR